MMLGHLLNGEGLRPQVMLGTAPILSCLPQFEHGQAAGKWAGDTLMG